VRIVLFTGKGGVGKTTTAAATAVRLADRGVKTLLVSTDAAHSIADALAVPISGEPVEIVPSMWAVQIDPQRRLEMAWRDVQRYFLELLSRGDIDPITAEELTVLPGVDGILALLAVRDLAVGGQWDVLVVDCAPTAETLRLLALPEALGWYLRKVFPAQRRMARGARPLAALLDRGDTVPPDGLFEALLRLNDELSGVRQLLADPAVTTVRLVLTPEAVVVAEARRTFTALALYGYCVDLVVANRVFPGGRDAFRQGWVGAQQQQLARVRESFADVPVREVAYRPGEPIGAPALREVAAALYGAWPGDDPARLGAPGELMTVEADGEEYVLRIPLPLATRGAVEASRAGDDLVLTVAGHRRVITLPSVLRRCEVVRGAFVEHELRVCFRPDAALWPDGARGR
jgi:arsenite/tail-anchored protein-transporting ATPase